MRMQINHAGENRVGILQLDDVGSARDLLHIGINCHNLAVSDDDAGVATTRVADAVEQPATTNNELSAPRHGPLREYRCRRKQHRKQGQTGCDCNAIDWSSVHECHVTRDQPLRTT